MYDGIKRQVKYRFLVAAAVRAHRRTSGGENGQCRRDYKWEKRDRFFNLFPPLRVLGVSTRDNRLVPRFPLPTRAVNSGLSAKRLFGLPV